MLETLDKLDPLTKTAWEAREALKIEHGLAQVSQHLGALRSGWRRVDTSTAPSVGDFYNLLIKNKFNNRF